MSRLAAFAAAMLLMASADAAPLAPNEVPEALRDWTRYVLHGDQDRACPFLYTDAKQRRCAWPTALELTLNATGGEFSQTWETYAAAWIRLPGNAEHWPQSVTVNGAPAPVVEHDGAPAIRVAAGNQRVRGRLLWTRLPASLPIPPDTGLLTLRVAGQAVAWPELDAGGQLWLRSRDVVSSGQKERVELRVFRRVIDDIPLQLVTRLDFDVAGTQRELILPQALPAGALPLRLSSALPARLEPDGRLRLQVRPGRWSVELTTRFLKDTTALQGAPAEGLWPREEVWVYDARPALRLAEVEGVSTVDPRQTSLPAEWQQLPAYRVAAGETLRLKVVRRGDPDPNPDRLALKRTLWLDFAGSGYTIKDDLSGSLTRSTRLTADESLRLGQVTLDGQPQFITTLPDSPRQGVEVRQGGVQLSADSRYEQRLFSLPAVGWRHDLHELSATLNLPPGWTLFAALGADRAPGTWIGRWTLLDLFVVLIAALAVGRLWGPRLGVLTLLTLVLIWHQPQAPRYVWLSVLAAVALLRVLPAGRFASAARWFRNASLVVLAGIAIPYMVNELRVGLYPQLARPWQAVLPMALDEVALPAAAPVPEAPEPEESMSGMVADRALEKFESKSLPYKTPARSESRARLVEIDPNAVVQTGPGLPTWRWQQVALSWNGPVAQDERLRLLLLSPGANLLLALLRIGLLVALVAMLLGLRWSRGGGFTRVPGGILMLLLAPMLLMPAPEARAEFPDKPLRDELRQKLLEPPVCLPACADIARLRLDAAPAALTLRLEVHAQERVMLPLPARAGQWWPAAVLVNGAPARGLARAANGTLSVPVGPGIHQLVLSGPVAARETVQLPLPLRPRHVTVEANGWSVAGVHEDGVADAELELTRVRRVIAGAALPALDPASLPRFVRVERTLMFGLEWGVETRVQRLSPPGAAVVMELPLIEGESVTSEGVRVSGGKVQVNMGPQQYETRWQSVLDKRAAVTLRAADTGSFVELWRADVSPIWHLEAAGLAPVHHHDASGRWLPAWQPWPGESLQLTLTRPLGVTGQTLTIDSSQLKFTPGRRASEAELDIALRSSQGGQHTLLLPAGAHLESATIDGSEQPIRQDGLRVTVPVSPGAQRIGLRWRGDDTLGLFYRTPAVDLGAPSVNAGLSVAVPGDRWVLFTGGPRLGPAVLFWGLVAVLALLAFGLQRVALTPLRGWHWFLLGIGLSQLSIWAALVVVGWLFALAGRERIKPDLRRRWFNAAQIGLGLLTVLALALLLAAIKQGLLGSPDMQVVGNGSSAWLLQWYQDRMSGVLPRGWTLSVPMFVYRLLMLAWALWLAAALLGWLRWGWNAFSTHGLWRGGRVQDV